MIEDILAALVAHLKAQSGIASLAGTRVFALELPEAETVSMPRHALVLAPSGGFSPGYTTTLALDAMRIDAFSYGPTPFEAMKLRRAVRAGMKGISRVKSGTALIHWALPAGGFADERDPQTRWPRVFESFSVMGSENAAA